MTTSRSERVQRADIRIVHADSNDPDDISFEAWMGDRFLLSIHIDADGNRTIYCGGFEFDADEFKALIDEGFGSVLTWEKALREPGGTWSEENG